MGKQMEFKIKLLNGETKTVTMGKDHLYRITTFVSDEFEERRRFYTGVYIDEVSSYYLRTTYKDGFNKSRHRSDYNSISFSELENIEEMVL
jgi:hypothetical protein